MTERLISIHDMSPRLADRDGGTLVNVTGTRFRDCAHQHANGRVQDV